MAWRVQLTRRNRGVLNYFCMSNKLQHKQNNLKTTFGIRCACVLFPHIVLPANKVVLHAFDCFIFLLLSLILGPKNNSFKLCTSFLFLYCSQSLHVLIFCFSKETHVFYGDNELFLSQLTNVLGMILDNSATIVVLGIVVTPCADKFLTLI